MSGAISFADCDLKDAKIVFFGVPYDSTTCFRPGTRFGPDSIRDASYNLENYDLFLKKTTEGIADMGNVTPTTNYGEIREEIGSFFAVMGKRFPVVAGGEHSITPLIVEQVKKRHKNMHVLILDAHLDFREKYMGSSHSHACSTRRTSEIVGIENVTVIGVRSASEAECEEANLEYFTSFKVKSKLKEVCERIKEINDDIYLSIDMDCFDPSFAPGVGNPEFYGLSPFEVRTIIESIGNMVGFDVVETNPLFDNGNTSCLAAKLIQEIVLRV